MALWTKWLHAGDLQSAGFSQLVSMDVESFCGSMSSSLELRHHAHLYAKLYVERFKEQSVQTDLWLYEEVPDLEKSPTQSNPTGMGRICKRCNASSCEPFPTVVLHHNLPGLDG